MPKIAIHNTHGAFSVSREAARRLADQGLEAARDALEQFEKGSGRWWDGSLGEDISVRADPRVIAVIEEMGRDASNYPGEILIVDVPDDVDWVIQDYDGKEWVAERHRRWPEDHDY